MKTYRIKKDDDKIIVEDRTVWMGIDMHKRQFTVVIVDDEGEVFRDTFPYGKTHLKGLIERLPGCEIYAVYEAGAIGYQPLRWLREFGCNAFMTPPSLIPQKPGDQVKTDRRDARELAETLRADRLKAVYDLDDQAYADREITRTRKQLVEHRTRICQQIESKLTYHGIERPEEINTKWTKADLEWLASGPSGRPAIDVVLLSLVKTYRHLDRQIGAIEEWLEALAETPRYRADVELLTTAPQVGVVTAMTFLVELQDVVGRFPTCEKLAGFLGLVPSESSSAGRGSKGSITRAGNKRVRTALVEAAWRVFPRDEQLKEVYERIKRNRGENGAQIAIVAVARRLALAFRAMLRDRKGWREQQEEDEAT